jgi:hypothetical protein
MALFSFLRSWLSTVPGPGRRARRRGRKVASVRPWLESLEVRDVPSFSSPISTSLHGSPAITGAATGDFNHDGKDDLVTISPGQAGVHVMLGKGNGQFGSPVYYSFLAGTYTPSAVAVEDINGDGNKDIVIGMDTGDSSVYGGRAGIGILLGRGDGTFGDFVTYSNALPMVSGPSSLIVRDLDGVGMKDIVAVTQGEVDVAYFTGSYWASWAFTIPVRGGGGPTAVAAQDFNGDSRLDLVVTDGTGAAYVLLSNSTGFAAPKAIAAGGSADGVAADDVNGDGKMDIVTANGQQGTVSVLLGNGDGTFGPARTFAVGGPASSVAVGDFNKDGKLDIVTTGSGMDVLLNNGDGTFGTAQKVGPAGSQVMVADFNGDGFLDLAQIDGSSSSIDILLNKADWQAGGSKGHK